MDNEEKGIHEGISCLTFEGDKSTRVYRGGKRVDDGKTEISIGGKSKAPALNLAKIIIAEAYKAAGKKGKGPTVPGEVDDRLAEAFCNEYFSEMSSAGKAFIIDPREVRAWHSAAEA